MAITRLVLGALLLACGTAAHAESFNVTISGASPGGLWSRIGKGIDAAIAAAHPGSTVTYQTSSGGLANVPLVANGRVPMGMATDGELTLAWTGQEPFKAPIKSVRVLFRTYLPAARFQATHLLMNKEFADEHGIETFADLVAKKPPVRVAINRRGNMDSDISRLLMEEMGVDEKAIESWGGQLVHAASREITSLLLDRRIDFGNFGIAYKHPRVREIAAGITPMVPVMPREVVEKVAKKLGGEVCTIEAREYEFLDRDFHTICVGQIILVNENMPDDEAYRLTKAVVEQIEQFKTAHRLIAKTATPQVLATPGIAPHHPGALRYFKEAGLAR